MSLAKKECRPALSPEMHERLAIMAEYRDLSIQDLAASLLEKAIAYEWHEVSLLIERSERLGRRRKDLDKSS